MKVISFEPFIETPLSLSSLGEPHNIWVKVKGNRYGYYVDGKKILAVEEKGEKSIKGNRTCLILWNETDSSGITCEISNVAVRNLVE